MCTKFCFHQVVQGPKCLCVTPKHADPNHNSESEGHCLVGTGFSVGDWQVGHFGLFILSTLEIVNKLNSEGHYLSTSIGIYYIYTELVATQLGV